MAERILQTGRVLAIESGEAVVALAPRGCAACVQKSACGIGRLTGAGRNAVVRVPACEDLQVGEAVAVGADAAMLARAAALAYLAPAVGIVGGCIAGDWASTTEAGAVLGALGGFVAGLAVVRLCAGRRQGVALHVSRPPPA